jgi:nucleoside 2-deoxyribosyltransferase
MPFDPSFDDVYSMIKATVESTLKEQFIKCYRLDEARPAGRITDRLLKELQASAICVADLTGNKPNVMWEVGYAMALSKPLLIVTQEMASLPFDLKDMQSLQYDRNHLSTTLGKPLRQALTDTISDIQLNDTTKFTHAENSPLQQDLVHQVIELKEMIGQLVKAWEPTSPLTRKIETSKTSVEVELSFLEGNWINTETKSHLYAKIINSQLLMPYCFRGNDELTACYYDWKKMGDYWFARFKWFYAQISGFSFLKLESDDLVTGTWWYDYDAPEISNSPIEGTGEPLHWIRNPNKEIPSWASHFFQLAQNGKISL